MPIVMKIKVIMGFALLLILSAFKSETNANDFVIIVNGANPVTSLTVTQVKLTYLRKINRRWEGLNKNILPVDRKVDCDVKRFFLKTVLQMTNDELNRYFTEREYQNAEPPPAKLVSDDEVLNYVSNNVGAIGYVKKSAVSSKYNVKTVLEL